MSAETNEIPKTEVPKKTNTRPILIIISIVFLFLVLIFLVIYFLLNSSGNKPEPKIKQPDLDNLISGGNTPIVTKSPGLDYKGSDYVYSGSAPIYVTIYSHNEDSWESMVNTKVKYIKYREGLLDRIALLQEYGIEWDWQSDQPVIEAMLEYEDDSQLLSATGGKNILKYMNDLGISLDPHAHTNNYADIAHLITELGANPSQVIGGTVQVKCGSSYLNFLELDDWHKNIDLGADSLVHGEDYPDAVWDPKILSDPGMGGHFFDDWSSGVWQPGNSSDFYTHDPASDIVYVGEGYPHDATIIGPVHASDGEIHASDGQYIKELSEKIADKELPTGTKDGEKFMYTASLHVRDTAIVTESGGTVTLDGLRSVLEELEPLRAEGKVIYLKFEDVVELWEQEYNSVPYRIDLTSFSFYDDVKLQAQEYCQSRGK